MKNCPKCRGSKVAKSGRKCPACKGVGSVSEKRFKELESILKDVYARNAQQSTWSII